MGRGLRGVLLLLTGMFGGTAWVPAAMAQAVPVEAFARASPFSLPRLSPTGEYLAFSTDFGEGSHAVQVLRLSDMTRTAVLRLPRYESPFQIAWVAAGIQAPVLLVHGERDERAPIAQANAMRSALIAAGKAPGWMAVPGEGHGFYSDDNGIAFYRALEKFLQEHIGG